MSAWLSPTFHQQPPLDRPHMQARLAKIEDQLAVADQRLGRVWACLAQQRARGWDMHGSEMTLQNMAYVLAQWQRQRQALLDALWQDAG